MPALATDAVFPVEEVQTDAAAVMAAEGAPAIVTSFFADAVLQPLLLVTVTDKVTDPDPLAV